MPFILTAIFDVRKSKPKKKNSPLETSHERITVNICFERKGNSVS